MVHLPGFPVRQAEAGGEHPPAKRRRSWNPFGRRRSMEFEKSPIQEEAEDMRGLNSGATTAAQLQLAVAISGATINIRDYGDEPDETRTLITTSFGAFFIENVNFPALVRKKWPDLSDNDIAQAWDQLCDIMRIERLTAMKAARQSKPERRHFHRGLDL